ncbi:unnamed protein product [Brassicogethes aeneus]|uniref:Uncharacterized protein n=1 Tax=Brassicogethes aeneus TaxID=1431903 RepID=A0A9P0B2J3_BRAAE|nr:unnamed protein product [Brassicogethes aeneus]
MPKARTHEENRLQVCLFCFGKTKTMFFIKEGLKLLVKKHFEYKDEDDRLPAVLCSSCKRDLYRINEKTIRLPKFSELKRIRRCTRSTSNSVCDCYICDLARKPASGNFAKGNILPKRIGILADTTNVQLAEKEKIRCIESRCSYCCSIIGKGLSHKCNLTTRLENLTEYILSVGSKNADQVVSSLLKRKFNEKEIKSTPSISLVQPRGKHLQVTLNQRINDNVKKQFLSADDFLKLQTSLNLSQKKTIAIAAAVRVATKNAKIVEPYLKTDKVSSAPETVAYCTDLEGLIQFIKEKRSLSQYHLKFGIDGGGGFLKICLSIQSTVENEDSRKCKQKFEDGICAKRFKDSGVNKLIILALAPSSQENYENVSQLWSEININNFKGTIATDLKLANILVGIMSHSSNYPCTWCYASKNNLKVCDTYRTIKEKLKSLQPTSSPMAGTYAEKLRKQSSIIIKPNDESQLNSVTKMDIMKKINPLVNSIKINSVKNIKNGGLIVGCNDVEEANKFKELADKELKDYKIKDANKIQPRVRIVGLSEKLNEEEIKQYLLLQNKELICDQATVKIVEIKALKNKDTVYQAVLQTDIITYQKLLKHGFVVIGLDSCKVYDAITVLRCFSCNGFNHDSSVCSKKNDPICPRCAENHSVKDCQSESLKCINCLNLKNKIGVDICHAAWDHDKCQALKNVLGKLKYDVFGLQ